MTSYRSPSPARYRYGASGAFSVLHDAVDDRRVEELVPPVPLVVPRAAVVVGRAGHDVDDVHGPFGLARRGGHDPAGPARELVAVGSYQVQLEAEPVAVRGDVGRLGVGAGVPQVVDGEHLVRPLGAVAAPRSQIGSGLVDADALP